MLEHDLGENLGPQEMQRLRRLDEAARKAGERTLFVPTFYAVGLVGREGA